MKKLLSVLAIAGLSCSLFALDIFNYAPVAGRVKSYTETEYAITSKFGNYLRTPNIKVTHTFDNFGRETDSLETTARDKIIDRIASVYDANGNLLSQTCTDADEAILWTSEVTYKDGKKVDVSEYNASHTLKAKSIYTYEGSNLVDETGYDGDGVLVWKIVYKYGTNGSLSEENLYNGDGSLAERKSYTYTDNGIIEAIFTVDQLAEKKSEQHFRYSSAGLLNEITTYDEEGEVIARVVLKYDAKGNVTRISEYSIANKFGTTVNELTYMKEITYNY